jgi:hypothetical protein
MKVNWPGNMSGGKLTIQDLDGFKNALAINIPYTLPVTITVEVARITKRSKSTAYLFGVLYKLISLETGYTTDEVHKLAKDQFNEGKTTTDLKPEQLSAYIDNVKSWAITMNITIPEREPCQTK